MNRNERTILRVRLPLWFLYFYAIGAPITFVGYYIFWLHQFRHGFTWGEAWQSIFLFVVAILEIWVVPIFFSSMAATETGFKFYRYSRLKRQVLWDEITRVSLPRFGIPHDAIYIFLKDGEKIVLMKSMNGCGELLRLIDSKARHAQIDGDVLPFMDS
jgi:hypothetical protein